MDVTFSENMGSGSAGASLFPLLVGAFGLAMTILWVVIAWRAMRAHERIAGAVERWVRSTIPPRYDTTPRE